MTSQRRAMDVLPTVLADLAKAPYPDYVEDVLADTRRQRQRPAWTFPERWLPDLASTPVLPSPSSWRALTVALVLVALILAAVVALIGGRQRLPAPFGPAANGLVAYESGGDIYTADPVTGDATAIVTGPEHDLYPQFSLDGTRIAFERRIDGAGSMVYVGSADGRQLTPITPEPVSIEPGDYGRKWERFEFSPDGREVVMTVFRRGVSRLAIAAADGSGMRILDLGMYASEPSYRPPDGAEILFIGRTESSQGIFIYNVATETVREVVPIPHGWDVAGASWSPDGQLVAYWSWSTGVMGMSARSHVARADGTGMRELPRPPGAVWGAHATWSNDGTRLFVAYGFTLGYEDIRGYVVPADSSSSGFEVSNGLAVESECCAAWIWSPDDTKLIGRTRPLRGEPAPPLLIDVVTRTAGPAPWAGSSDPAWQRRAP